MLKAFVFDCFGLFYPDPVLARKHAPHTPVVKAAALHTLDEQAARGLVTKEEFIRQAAELLDISPDEAEREFFHGRHRDQRLVNCVQGLRASYKVALLSNIGGDMMDGFFTPAERAELFDVIVLSGDVRMAKPDRAIFELVCDHLGVALEEAVMVDDVPRTCAIAQTIGMQSICYRDFAQFTSELIDILG